VVARGAHPTSVTASTRTINTFANFTALRFSCSSPPSTRSSCQSAARHARPRADRGCVYGGAMTPDEMVAAAIEVGEAGRAPGEPPFGGIVVMGDEIVGSAYASERTLRRHLLHADLLAMIQADTKLAFAKRPQPLQLAVNLEPCVMCLGAAMVLGVADV